MAEGACPLKAGHVGDRYGEKDETGRAMAPRAVGDHLGLWATQPPVARRIRLNRDLQPLDLVVRSNAGVSAPLMGAR